MKRKTWIELEQEFILSTARSVPCLDRQVILQSILAPGVQKPPLAAFGLCTNGTKCEAVSIGATYPVNALIHGLCYFCHLYATNYAYASAVNGETEFGSIRLPFYVKTNLPGQYCHEKTLQLAQGPFPIYDKNHYVLCSGDGSWYESNVMCYANGLSVKSDRVLPDHPMGEGEQLHPIRPSFISCTTYTIPTVEYTLYHQYGLLGKKTNKRIAQCIFQESLKESHTALLPLFKHPKCSKERVKEVVQKREQELDAYLASPAANQNVNDCCNQTWYATVWCRVYVFAPESPKISEFRNRHVPLLMYFDTLPSKDDKYVDPDHLCALYKRLGATQYDEDRNLIERVTVRYPTRPHTWLDILKSAYPSAIWTVEAAMDYLEFNVRARNDVIANIVSNGYSAPGLPWDKHKYHYSCTMIMVQCRSANNNLNSQSDIRADALYFYHGCFLDFYFSYANKPDSEIDFNRVYPYPNRCFTAYDLPNAFHVLMNIPNHGEKKKPDFVLGKFIQKTLPFCCAYRTLINVTDSLICSDLAFWKVFSSVFYCLLLDMYPDQPPTTRRYDIGNMMRAMQLCADRNAMRAAITRSQVFDEETDRGCNIIYTAFRMWILFMTKDQRHYNAFAHDLSDEFAQKTHEMARLIRVDDSPDPFATSRDLLQGIKSSPLVYRYQNQNLVHTLHEKMSVRLEKKLYGKKHDDIQHLSDYIKTNILNDLIYTPKAEWLKRDCMERLYGERFGGISGKSIECFIALLQLYTKGAKPKEYELLLEKIEDYDFQVIAWYVFVVKTLQSFQFEAVSLQWRSQLQTALIHRKHSCTIFVTICCNKIKSLTGIEEYGTNNVALDMKTGMYVCAKTPKKAEIDGLMSLAAPQSKKEKRDRRKNFYTIPCDGNPVIPIDLEGCILYYKNTTRYLHCPSCGAFHIYKTTNWMGRGEFYRCENCCKPPKRHITCKMCALPATDLTCAIMDPTDLTDPIQHVYFCKNHYTHAKTNAHNLAWSDLSRLIGERHYKRMTK